jgi:hypothetical protein
MGEGWIHEPLVDLQAIFLFFRLDTERNRELELGVIAVVAFDLGGLESPGEIGEERIGFVSTTRAC